MSRSGYSDDLDNWDLIRWRGAVNSAIRGKRGQAFLRETLTALDAIEDKRLVANELEDQGEVCALGAVGLSRNMDMNKIDPNDREHVAEAFQIPHSLACEIMYENDEGPWKETPEQRYARVRAWVVSRIAESPLPQSN